MEDRILVRISPAVWQKIKNVPGVRTALARVLDTGDTNEFDRIVKRALERLSPLPPVPRYVPPPAQRSRVQVSDIPQATDADEPLEPLVHEPTRAVRAATQVPLNRKRVLIVADVPNWAWAKKAAQLQKHVPEFEVDVCYLQRDGLKRGYDLYHTFDFVQITNIPAGMKATTGITAHVWKTWEGRYGEGTVRGWAQLAAGVHANSVLLQKEIEEYLRQRVYYLPNGVDEQLFHRYRPHPRGKLVVGFVGKPNPRKGRDMIQQAAHRAGVEFKEIYRSSHTALSSEEVRDFYQDIHVLAVASNMDGTPNPALEAAACGCAIVSNRIGNMPEFIKDGVNGVFVERETASLAEAFKKLSVQRAIEMGREARRTVEAEWTWAKMARNYANMWREVIR